MTKDQIKSILDRVPSWPVERQAELALEIEAEACGEPYVPTDEELAAIDEGLAGGPASDEEVAAVFARFRRT